jgi:hypothetical protein
VLSCAWLGRDGRVGSAQAVGQATQAAVRARPRCARGLGHVGEGAVAGSRAQLRFGWAAGGRRGAGPQKGQLGAEGGFPFYYFFFLFFFYFPDIKFIYNNELHIRWIHAKAKHHTKTNVFPHDASTILPLGFY